MENGFRKDSAIDEWCLPKACMSAAAGAGFGLVMSMFMSGVQMRDMHISPVKRSTKHVLRKDWKRVMSSAKGFGVFGGVFVLYECMIEKVRGRQDGFNSFGSGFLSSVTLAADAMRGKQLIYSGLGGGAMCWAFYKVFKMLGY